LTYSEGEEGYKMSPLGEKLDHLTLAVAELIRRGFPIDVVHAVAAHHGRGGPSPPRTIEALICSLADSVDAGLNGEALNAARWLVRDCLGEEVKMLTAEEAFSILRAKQDRGCEGVAAAYEKIRSMRATQA
jgi:7,8-dihydroneopterin 2',3'-cyclic phosphate phosphodiesterase